MALSLACFGQPVEDASPPPIGCEALEGMWVGTAFWTRPPKTLVIEISQIVDEGAAWRFGFRINVAADRQTGVGTATCGERSSPLEVCFSRAGCGRLVIAGEGVPRLVSEVEDNRYGMAWELRKR